MLQTSAMSFILVLWIVLLGCSNAKEEETVQEQVVQTKVEENRALQEYSAKLLANNQALALDDLFKDDSSVLTYSYKIESKLTNANKPLLGKGIITDIIKLSDNLFIINCMVLYKKANNKGVFYGELKCNQALISKIENLNIGPNEMVFFTFTFSELKTLDFEIKDKEEYDINFDYFIEQSHTHRAKGFCLDVDYNAKFNDLSVF